MTDLIKQAQKHYKTANDFWSSQYEMSEEDWSFLYGIGQWSDKEKKERELDGNPCLVLNQLLPYAHQVTNDIKQARFSVRLTPVDSEGDPDTAEIRAGVIRNIEKQSKSKDVYGTAAMYAIGAGIGWFTISTDYCDESSFEQEAKINRIVDYTSILLDPLSEEIDGSDAEYGFEKIIYSKEKFKKLYPDLDCTSFDTDGLPDDSVLVVKYYWKDYKKDTIHKIRLVDGSEQIVNAEKLKELEDYNKSIEDGETNEAPLIYDKVMSREVDIPTVYVAVLSGADVLEDKEEFPSQYIPIIPVIGEEVYLDHKREFHSLIRPAKDGQRMYNYWASYSTETVALQPKTPWVGAEGAFDGDAENWADANRKNIPYLEYTPVTDENGVTLPPPQRQPQVQGSPFMAQQQLNARDDIRLSLGMSSANMGERSNIISGIALRTNQIEGDNATFHFSDNLASSISHGGRILNDIISTVYTDKKIVRIIGEDEAEKLIPVNQPFVKEGQEYRVARNGETPQGTYRFDVGKYDVVADVGASYSSKRQETADKLTELMSVRPDLMDIAGDIFFDVVDMPEADRIAERLRAKNPSLAEDNPMVVKLKELTAFADGLQKQLDNAMAALEDKKKNEEFDNMVELKKLELDQQELQIKAQKTAAEIEKMRAETSGYNMEAVAALGNAMAAMNEQVNDITESIGIIIEARERDNMASGEPESPDLASSEPESDVTNAASGQIPMDGE